VCCLLVLNLVSSTPPCIRQLGPRIRVLGVCDFVQVCTQTFIGFLAFELLVNNASSDTLAFSLRLVPSLPAADAPATRAGSSASPYDSYPMNLFLFLSPHSVDYSVKRPATIPYHPTQPLWMSQWRSSGK
jgi:hypothetical protein